MLFAVSVLFACERTEPVSTEDPLPMPPGMEKNKEREVGRNIYLVPSGFGVFNFGVFKNVGEIVTTDADTFWAAPVKKVL